MAIDPNDPAVAEVRNNRIDMPLRDSSYTSCERSTNGDFETFDQHRAVLFGVAYRMLGSAADAEDLLQETFIRWLEASKSAIKSSRAFLLTILTRLCIDNLRSARVQRETYFGQWLPEPLVTLPRNNPLNAVEIDESLSLAFLLILERLTPVERAVLVLREVFDYEYSEIGSILDQSEPNCRQILRRARQHVKEDRARFRCTPGTTRGIVAEIQ